MGDMGSMGVILSGGIHWGCRPEPVRPARRSPRPPQPARLPRPPSAFAGSWCTLRECPEIPARGGGIAWSGKLEKISSLATAGPRLKGIEQALDLLANLVVGELARLVELGVGGGDHHLRLVEDPRVQVDEDLPQVILRAAAGEGGACGEKGDRLAVEWLVGRPRRPVDGVLATPRSSSCTRGSRSGAHRRP